MKGLGKKNLENILKDLRNARKSATFETASFHPFDKDADRKNAEIKEATRIYRNSWILSPLDNVIEHIEAVLRETAKDQYKNGQY